MLNGYELEFRGVATIVPKKEAKVPVLIWEIDQRDECSLDRYEGFPSFYRKELFPMNINGKDVEVMAYLMNKGSIAPPSKQYYDSILEGYRANSMDTKYLKEALERSFENMVIEETDDELYDDNELEDDLQMTFR